MERRTRRRSAVLACVAALLASGCAGGRGFVRAEQTQVPISFSDSLPGSLGEIYRFPGELVKVGEFKHSANAIGFFYGATSDDVDISEAVDAQVKAAGGDGIVAFSVGAGQCAANAFLVFTALPFWPGCVRFDMTGIIVGKVRR